MQIDRKKPVWIEIWNALSMLPGFYFIYHHLQRQDAAPALQRLGVYSYGFVCLLSMQCHLYRSVCSYTPYETNRYMRFLRMDLVAQSVSIALNAYYTPLGIYGVLWAIVGVALDIYNTSGNHNIEEYISKPSILIRPIHEGILICALTRHSPETVSLFIQAFACFALSKLWRPLEFLHGIFHILTHGAMNALWYSQYDYMTTERISIGWESDISPDMVAGVALVIMIYTSVQNYGKRWKYFDRVLTSTYFAMISLYVYAIFYDNTKLFDYVSFYSMPWVARLQILSELCYYIAAAGIEIYEREWVLLGHHAVAFSVIYLASDLGYAHLLVWCLAMFMPSNVPLTVSKYARAAGHERLARGAFGAFTALYVGFRITGLTWFLYQTLVVAYSLPMIPSAEYVGMNGLILSLYALHLFWLGKIARIWWRPKIKTPCKTE